MPVAKDVAVIVNNEDANIVLPTFFLSKSDEEGNRNPQRVVLGAAMDRGVVHTAQPEYKLNAYSYARLKDHPIIRALVMSRRMEFRAPGLVLDLGT